MPSRRTVQVLDAALVLWLMLWLWAGVTVARTVDKVGKVSDSMESSSQALDATADGLDTVSHAPFVGKKIGGIADHVRETAASTHRNAVETRSSVHRFAGLLGFCIFAVPVAPPALLYGPLRWRRYREDRAIDAALASPADRQLLEAHLAHRAVAELPFDVLRSVSDDPWRDLHEGRYEALARVQADRAGVRLIADRRGAPATI